MVEEARFDGSLKIDGKTKVTVQVPHPQNPGEFTSSEQEVTIKGAIPLALISRSDDKPSDVFKPFLYVNAGIVGASVVLAAAALTALSNTESNELRTAVGGFFERMGLVIIAAVLVAMVLQTFRSFRYHKKAFKNGLSVVLSIGPAMAVLFALGCWAAFDAWTIAQTAKTTTMPATQPEIPPLPPVQLIAPDSFPAIQLLEPETSQTPAD